MSGNLIDPKDAEALTLKVGLGTILGLLTGGVAGLGDIERVDDEKTPGQQRIEGPLAERRSFEARRLAGATETLLGLQQE